MENELGAITRTFEGDIERYDGETMTHEQLADVMMGQTLFTLKRLVIVRGLAANKPVWGTLSECAHTMSSDITLVLIEQSLDKRTKSYKALASFAKMIFAPEWTERQTPEAREWLVAIANERGVMITEEQAREMVERAVVANDTGSRSIDQSALYKAVDILPEGEVSDDAIDAVLPPSTYANVFNLLETALTGNDQALSTGIARLRHAEDPYRLMGLLASQWGSLVAITFATITPAEVARELGISPYAASSAAKLVPHLTQNDVERFTRLLADMDYQMKSVSFDPWLAVERFLHELATRNKTKTPA